MGKGKTFGKLILVGLAAQMLLATPIHATTLDQLKEQSQEKQTEITQLEQKISDKLNHINTKKAEVEELNTQIAAIESEKEETILAIEDTKEQIAARKTQLQERLVALQTSSTATNRILMIFESESFTDFLGRIMLVGQLQAADNERIEAAIDEEAKLADLETKLEEEIQFVQEKSALVATETESMNAEIVGLQSILNDNRSQLDEIFSAQTAEETRLAEVERAEKEAAERIAAAQAAEVVEEVAPVAETPKVTEPAPSQPKPVEKPKETAPDPDPAPASKGWQLTVSATAYSRHEAGLTNFTFTGIDLRENPMVIAVDPSVIPLYSLVDVPGYGIAIAGDTGGAIKGNKIDLHMEDMARMNAFGRQTMTVTILE